MYPDLFVGWLDFRFLRPASLESFPLLVISVIKHIINHHHHMWLVWSVSQARQGLEMYPQSHTVKEYHIIGWLVKSSHYITLRKERKRGGRRLTAPVLEVVETGVIGRFQDHVHPAEPGSVHLTNLYILYIVNYKFYDILNYILSILLNPCLSILPTFSALQTTVIPWSEMFPLFCECYSLYCSLNSKKMIELSLAFGPFVITISHYLSRYIRSNSNCQERQDPSLSLTISDQDPCSPCLRVSSQNHWLCFPGRVKNCNIAQLENKFWRSPMDQKCSDTVASWVNYWHFFLQYSNISRNAFWKS